MSVDRRDFLRGLLATTALPLLGKLSMVTDLEVIGTLDFNFNTIAIVSGSTISINHDYKYYQTRGE